jgi:carboxyl-terminal processing protease
MAEVFGEGRGRQGGAARGARRPHWVPQVQPIGYSWGEVLMRARSIVLRVALSVACIVWAALPLDAQALTATDRARVLGMLKNAYETVKLHYYDPKLRGLDWEARYRAYGDLARAAPTMTDALTVVAAFLDGLKDPHTSFDPPPRPYRIEYGFRLGVIGDDTYVTRVRPDTDAVAKLHAGDRVIGVNGFRTTRDTLPTLVYLMHTLQPLPTARVIVRDGQGADRDVEVASKVTPGEPVRDGGDADYLVRQAYVEAGDVMIWKLPTFLLPSADMDRILGVARKHAALVLDLRGNAGGSVEAMSMLLGGVFDHDIEFASRVTRTGSQTLLAKSWGHDAFTGKLVVLVDSASTAAAEVFARVVQIEQRGMVVGDRSAGSVMEARGFTFETGDEVVITYGFHVTDADLVMKDGKSVERVGVTPGEVVLPTAQDLAAGRDPALARAAVSVGLKLDAVAAGRLFPFVWRPF